MYKKILLFLFLTLVITTGSALAKVTPEEAAQLGGPQLTPMGAERAGNAEGTISAWTGGITSIPAGYKPGVHHPDPYQDDKVVLTITSQNLDDYAEHLTEGQKALFKTYPETWKMNVYPTRRSASYPEWVYEAVKTNAVNAEVIMEGKGGVNNSVIGQPFPIPKNGIEVVWNHLLRWHGVYVTRSNGLAAVTLRGHYKVVIAEEEIAFPYALHRVTSIKKKYPNILFAIKQRITQPASLSGRGTLVFEFINQTLNQRKSWSYSPAFKRVFREPYLAYDRMFALSEGLTTVDDFDTYNGSPDRYEWKLLGKKEVYIPYNAYKLHSDQLSYSDILKKGHINPDLARYELHRVWVVEGTLKKGETHVYSRRVFFIDEDTWQLAVADTYDKEGNLWRVIDAHILNYYEVPCPWTTLEVYHDLKVKRYLATGLDNQRNTYHFSEKGNIRQFNPNALNYYVR
jgi:hypothetical protein